MGATLASISGAVWAQLLSGESSSSSGGVVEHIQHPQHLQHPQHSQHSQHPLQQQLLSPSSDAFHQCGGSSPPGPLSHHWEAAAAAHHDMDYPSHPHHHYMMAPPSPHPPQMPNNSGEPIAISQLSNVQWTSSGETLHSGLLHHQHPHQHQHQHQHPHQHSHSHSDFQEPFIVPNPHMTLLNESAEDCREGKRPAGGVSLGNGEEINSSADLYKRPRLEPQVAAASSAATSASACVPFKSQVRKEKLGERITALQQLVSPFGKTDTASVLLEAIGYIKFLQEQVQVLSTPYMKPNVCAGSINHHDSHELGKMPSWPSSNNCKVKSPDDVRQDLRSRGLCLVPVSCTLQVANDNGADFWTPAIGGSCR